MLFKLMSESGRWALRDNSMIFTNVVWVNEEDLLKNKYHLIDENGKEISSRMIDYIIEDDFFKPNQTL